MKSISRIKSIVGWFWLVLLSMICSMPLVLYATWKMYAAYSWTSEHPIAFLQFLWVLAAVILVLIGALVNKGIRVKQWDKRGNLRIAVLALFTFFLLLFNIDDRKIDNDYTWADLPNPPKAEESYALLLKTFGSQSKITELKLPDDMEAVNKDPLKHKEEIERWWRETGETRALMAKLNEFEMIGDMTGEDLLSIRFTNIRKLFRVIYAYTALKAIEGNIDEGLTYLTQCHSVVRKVLPCSRFLINKIIWLANASNNIKAAYDLACQSNTSKETLQMLKSRFAPITEQELAIKKTFISEYLFTKSMAQRSITEDQYLSGIFNSWHVTESCRPKFTTWKKAVSALFFHATYKPNRTLHETKSYYDFIILISDKKPFALGELKTYETGKIGKLKVTNIGYWIMTQGSLTSWFMSDYIKRIAQIKVRSDLLAFYLDQKLGEKSNLKDFYTGIDYQLDEKYGARSAGPDGQFNTEDDITLN